MNPSTWLTRQQPFDCCSWFATASHRNTNKIFNVGARELLGYRTQRRTRNVARTLWFGEIEKTWLQNPSHINRVLLSLKNLLIYGLWCPLDTGSNGSQFRFQTNKLWAFSSCWFLLIREARSIEKLSRLL